MINFDYIFSLLPQKISSVITSRLNLEKLYEIRLRCNKPLTVNYGGLFYYLGQEGIVWEADKAFIINDFSLNEIVLKASEYSLYAVNTQLCGGFLTIAGGIRIGVGGETVWDNNSIKTVKNFNCLNIRLPHEIIGCAQKAFDSFKGNIKNTLVVSPPGFGKTTILRDLSRLIGSTGFSNVLLVDERNELASSINGVNCLNVGFNTDIINNCSKEYAFNQGIRSLRPDVIITDELSSVSDFEAAAQAMSGGVKVIASAHAGGTQDLKRKDGFKKIEAINGFERYIILDGQGQPGNYKEILDANFEPVVF